MRNFSFPVFNILASAIAAISIIIFLLIWQTSSIIFNLEGLQKEIESRIIRELPGVRVNIKKVNLSFENFSSPIGISVRDINISNEEEKIEIKESRLIFSLTNIFSGNFKINKMILDGLNFEYYQGTKNEILLPLMHDLKLPQLIANIIIKNSREVENASLSGLFNGTEYKIINGKVNFKNFNKNTAIKKINVVFQNLENKTTLNGVFNLNNNPEKIKVSFDSINQIEKKINLDFNMINYKDIKEFIFLPNLESEIYLSGKINIDLNKTYLPENLSGFINFEKSQNRMENTEIFSFLNIFNRGKIEFNYDYKNNLLNSEKFTFENNSQSKINGSFLVKYLEVRKTEIYFNANLNNLSSDIFPKEIIPRDYKLELSGGEFNNLNFRGNVLVNNDDLKYLIEDLDVEGQLKELKISSSYQNSNKIETLINSNFKAKIKSNKLISIDTIVKLNGFGFERNGMLEVSLIKEAKFRMNYNNNEIKITELSSDLVSNTKVFGNCSILLNKDKSFSEVQINLNFDKILYSTLTKFWPNEFGKKTRDWIKSNVYGGFAEKGKLSLVLDFFETPIVKNIKFNWLHRNSEISFYKNLPTLILSEARIEINNDKLEVDFIKSNLSKLVFDKGQLKISPIFNKKAQGFLKLEGQSELSDVLSFLDHKDLNLISKYKIGKKGDGKIYFDANFSWPIKEKIKINEFIWQVKAEGNELNFLSLPFKTQSSESNLKIFSNNNYFNLLHKGKINNIKTNLNFYKYHNQPPSVKFNIVNSNELTKYISNITGQKIDGRASSLVEINDFDLTNFTSKVVIDLENTEVKLPQLDFYKKPGINGLVKGDFTFKNGVLELISNFQGEVGSASFNGHVELVDTFFKKANFNYISLPGTLISTLHINRDDNKFDIVIDSEKINLDHYITYFSNNTLNQNGLKLSFKLNSEKFALPGGIEADGEINGIYSNNNGLNSSLKGSIYLGQEITIKDTKFFAKFSENESEFDGTGLINNTPIFFKKDNENKNNVFTISGNNAGTILKGFKITDLIQGGNVIISVTFDEQNFRNYSALIDVSKFNVVNAPILVRLVSTLSLTGLLNLLEEKGIYFAKGVAEIDNFDNKLNIRNIEAIGEAMAITLNGWIDKKSNFLQIHGTMAPATLLNKLLETVPVLSELLTGGDKAGIVLTEFRLDGNISKPSISFRPLSSAPGLLRDIFNIFRSDGEFLGKNLQKQ
mgnify:CR=1 FL=1